MHDAILCIFMDYNQDGRKAEVSRHRKMTRQVYYYVIDINERPGDLKGCFLIF